MPTGVQKAIDEILEAGRKAAEKYDLDYAALVRAYTKALDAANDIHRLRAA